MFNLVLALKSDEDTNDYISKVYELVLAKVAAALKYEQLRRLYIRKEAELILSIREELAMKSRGMSHQTRLFLTKKTMKRILIP